ncbi:GDSL esterase/lipase EXL1 [Platanthera zijinensis]|uniref:GDSL esterase/lipase EXL1 n=1 Tax=Platanthera zijinensis TaxID=2320716 RepID=A0AAP0C0U1_9ASPA
MSVDTRNARTKPCKLCKWLPGARKICVAGVPPIGCLPSQRTLAGGFERICDPTYNKAAMAFNSELSKEMQKLNNSLPKSNILFLDSYTHMLDMIINASSYDDDPQHVDDGADMLMEDSSPSPTNELRRREDIVDRCYNLRREERGESKRRKKERNPAAGGATVVQIACRVQIRGGKSVAVLSNRVVFSMVSKRATRLEFTGVSGGPTRV